MREIINLKLHEPPKAITTFDGLSLYLESKITLAFFFLEIFFYFFDVGYSEAFARLPLLDLRVTCYVNACTP